MRQLVFGLICFSFAGFSFAATKKANDSLSPYVPLSKTINHRAFELKGLVNYFQSSGYFDETGAATSFNEGSGFEKFDLEGNVSYGISDQLQMDLGTRYRQNHSFNTNVDIVSSGLESYTAGMKYSFEPVGRWTFATELRYLQTVYSNEDFAAGSATPTNQLVLGDTGPEVSILGHLSWQRKKAHFFSGTLGYRRLGNSLSPEFPWNLETAYIYNSWAFIGGIRGVESMGSSEYKDSVTLRPTQATGETHLFNSINRAHREPFIGVNYVIDNFRIEMKAAHVISGVSTDLGNEFQMAILYNTGGSSLSEKKVESFKEYQIEATILKISPRNTFAKIDQGSANGVEKGMKFDIFKTDYYGGNEMVATAIAYEVGASWSILKILKTYKDAPIVKGFTARGR